MSVYFIAVGPYIKVGYSRNPEQRCVNLFSGNTHYVAPWDAPRDRAARMLLGDVAGTLADEGRAHDALRDYSTGAEFFLDEPPVRDFIARCLAAGRVLVERVHRPDGHAVHVGPTPPLTTAEATSADSALAAALDRMFSIEVTP